MLKSRQFWGTVFALAYPDKNPAILSFSSRVYFSQTSLLLAQRPITKAQVSTVC